MVVVFKMMSKLETQDVDLSKKKAEPKPCLLKCLSNLKIYSASSVINPKTPSIIPFTSFLNSSSSIALTIEGLH